MSDETSDVLVPPPAFTAPVIDADSAPFWAGCREGRFVLQACSDCGTHRWPLGPVCFACRSRASIEVDASGNGTVYSWIWTHHSTVPVPKEQLPYCIVLVALDEDPRILVPGQFDGARTELVQGLAVEAVYRQATPDITVVRWRTQPEA